MCGIVGVLNLQAPRPILEATVRQMLAMLRHRGPDGFGLYRDDHVGLGSARLSLGGSDCRFQLHIYWPRGC
jgi:asparagine synthase (glutamine-hydrolysing)